jgi:hypothetical protein
MKNNLCKSGILELLNKPLFIIIGLVNIKL